MKRKITFVDSTLRDGEETAGVVFALREKVQIAKMLDEIGVDQIEVGIPVMGGDELEAIKQVVESNHRASIMAWNRPNIEDIEASIRSGVDAVAISIPTSHIHIANKLGSTPSQVVHDMVAATSHAKSYGLYISVSAEDASRTDMDFLVRFTKAAKEAGADRLRYCDTVGLLDPITTFERIKTLIQAVDIDIEMHTHNNFGMATANAVAGVAAGATHVNVTVNGLGERAGNAALEEVAMALKYVLDYKVSLNTTRFREISDYVAQASNREVPSWKAVVGSNMFTHSGRYSDGISKSPHAYDIFDPKEVGLERQIIIGKHSSAAAVKQKFREYGTEISDEDAQKFLSKIRETTVSLKRALFDKELILLYAEYLEGK